MPSRRDDQRVTDGQFFYSGTRHLIAAKLYCPTGIDVARNTLHQKYQAPSFSHTQLEIPSVAFPFGLLRP